MLILYFIFLKFKYKIAHWERKKFISLKLSGKNDRIIVFLII